MACPLPFRCRFTAVVRSPLQRDVLLNKELLAVNQDMAATAGGLAYRPVSPRGSEVWMRRLEDGSAAVALFNSRAIPANLRSEGSSLWLSLKNLLSGFLALCCCASLEMLN